MKIIALILMIVFAISTLFGVIYVLANKGTVNAGFAVIPMLLFTICLSFWRFKKHD